MLYFDNSATTKCYREAVDIMAKYYTDDYYNPSALYGEALKVAQDIKSARANVASLLGCMDKEIIFTSSGTESDNTVIEGVRAPKNGKIIVSAIEHSAIEKSVARLEQRGVEVAVCPVDRCGKINFDYLADILTDNTYLVSIMHVSNETGAINDLRAISELIKSKSPRAFFHSDGVQACGKIKINLNYFGVDAYSVSAHKFHGPKGIGALFLKSSSKLNPLIVGGGQERGMRSATENTGGIMAMSYALDRCCSEFDINKIKNLRNSIVSQISKIDENIIINTNVIDSAPHILSLALPNSRSEVLVHMMEDDGIIIGTGSACSSNNKRKRVPTALGLDSRYSMGLVRISLSQENSEEDIKHLLYSFDKNYRLLREKLQ